VVVADDPLSKDDTERIVNSYADRLSVRYIRADERGVSIARNKAILSVESDIDCFVDSDCVVDENWIKKTRKCWYGLEDTVAGLRGRILPSRTDFLTDLLAEGVYISEIHIGGADNISYRRKALLKVGLFDPRLTVNEDGDLADRVRKQGYRIEYDERIVVHHDYGFTVERFFKREVKFGRGFYMLWSKTKDPRTIAPVLLSFLVFLFIFVSFLSGTLFLFLSLMALSISAILYYRRYVRHFLRRKSPAYIPVLLAIYMLKNICNTTGFLIQSVRNCLEK
jgi:glycosyltransferase involved in cell wall biosynthesis